MNFLTKHIRLISVIAFILVVSVVLVISFSNKETTRTFFAFDTMTDISLSGKNSDSAASQIEQELIRLENAYSKFRDSEVSRYNALDAGQNFVFSDETTELLNLCLNVSRASDGNFDITTSALSDLWNVKNASAPPSQPDIDTALASTGYDKLLLNGSTATKTAAQIDFGGVLKGYAADKVRKIAQDNGVKSGIVNLGGNVCLIGSKSGKPWTVGIVNPFSTDKVYLTIQVSDTNVITSGAYQRNFEYEGKIYHHILSPKTGYPAETDVASATVISKEGALADALSTAIFVSGSEKGLALAESYGVDTIIIKKDGSVIATDGIKYNLN